MFSDIPPSAISGIWNLMKSKRGTFPYLGITRGIPNHLAVKQALHFQFALNFYFLHLRYGIQKKDGVVSGDTPPFFVAISIS